MEAEKMQRYLSSHGIRWQFIVERAPWWGGFYERLVGSVKRCLKKSLGKTLLSFPDIVTMVTEVEAVLNSWPLTYLYPDIEDNPPHFLCGYRLTTLPNLVKDKEYVDTLFIPPSAQASWSRVQELSKWIKHYESLNYDNTLDMMEKRVFAEPERISSPTTPRTLGKETQFCQDRWCCSNPGESSEKSMELGSCGETYRGKRLLVLCCSSYTHQ